jgi:hypothetical protein
MNGENEMTNNNESRSLRIIAFAVPVKVATATRAVADKDLCSLSDVCRRALLKDLKERGFLPEPELA